MERHRNRLALTALAVLLAALHVMAWETHISKSELPVAVQKAVAEQSQGGTVLGLSKEIEDGKTYYEMEMKVEGHSKDVLMDPSGAIVEIEEEVALQALSPAV